MDQPENFVKWKDPPWKMSHVVYPIISFHSCRQRSLKTKQKKGGEEMICACVVGNDNIRPSLVV